MDKGSQGSVVKKHKNKEPKTRNYIAFDARCRSWGAGSHPNRKKRANKYACRKTVRL